MMCWIASKKDKKKIVLNSIIRGYWEHIDFAVK